VAVRPAAWARPRLRLAPSNPTLLQLRDPKRSFGPMARSCPPPPESGRSKRGALRRGGIASCQGGQANSGFSSLYFLYAMVLALARRAEEAGPIVQRGLELEPSFRSRVIFEVGIVPAIVDKLAKGARLLGLPEWFGGKNNPWHQRLAYPQFRIPGQWAGNSHGRLPLRKSRPEVLPAGNNQRYPGLRLASINLRTSGPQMFVPRQQKL
jgi:hypothetical protein